MQFVYIELFKISVKSVIAMQYLQTWKDEIEPRADP